MSSMKYSKINRKQKSGKIFDVKPIFIFVMFFIAMQVFFNVQEGTLGVSLAEYQNEVSEIEKEKRELQYELVKSSSLLNLSKKAEELGYIKPNDTLYLKTQDQFAAVSTLSN